MIESGNLLKSQKHSESTDVSIRIDALKKNWDKLHELWAVKAKQLEDASAAYQVCITCIFFFYIKGISIKSH